MKTQEHAIPQEADLVITLAERWVKFASQILAFVGGEPGEKPPKTNPPIHILVQPHISLQRGLVTEAALAHGLLIADCFATT